MTANKTMTGEQLDELMTVAVNMQRDSEKAGDRPTAMFAFAVQVAVLELRKVRNDVAALAAENAGLKAAISCHAAGFTVCEACGEENISGNDDVCRALNETPATDAFLAEVRASGVEMCSAEIQKQTWDEREGDGMVAAIDAMEIYAAQLRKGVQS